MTVSPLTLNTGVPYTSPYSRNTENLVTEQCLEEEESGRMNMCK